MLTGRVIRGFPGNDGLPHSSALDSVQWATRELGVDVAPQPPRRDWGAALQVYALSTGESVGVGDLRDLREAALVLADLGASFCLLSPLFLWPWSGSDRQNPYAPGSRLLLDPVYISVEWAASEAGCEISRGSSEDGPRIQWEDCRAERLKVLRVIRETSMHRPDARAEFSEWCGSLRRVRLEAAAIQSHIDQDPRLAFAAGPLSKIVAALRMQSDDELNDSSSFVLWCQWQLHRQLSAVNAILPVWTDLPVGIRDFGVDGAIWPEEVALHAFLGAPPDFYSKSGQNWEIHGWHPTSLAEAGFVPFCETLRAALSGASGIRIDHVLGFDRSYWIPRGGDAGKGVYVQQDLMALLDQVVKIGSESNRYVFCEDIGTASDRISQVLDGYGLPGYRLMLLDPSMQTFCQTSVGAITNHDTPTLGGLWTGADLTTQHSIGLRGDEETQATLLSQLRSITAEPADLPTFQTRLHERLAGSACDHVMLHLEDAIGVLERPHLPGASAGPVWDRAHPVPVGSWLETTALPRLARILSER
jgi:4-alpha-glucanotransferase